MKKPRFLKNAAFSAGRVPCLTAQASGAASKRPFLSFRIPAVRDIFPEHTPYRHSTFRAPAGCRAGCDMLTGHGRTAHARRRRFSFSLKKAPRPQIPAAPNPALTAARPFPRKAGHKNKERAYPGAADTNAPAREAPGRMFTEKPAWKKILLRLPRRRAGLRKRALTKPFSPRSLPVPSDRDAVRPWFHRALPGR